MLPRLVLTVVDERRVRGEFLDSRLIVEIAARESPERAEPYSTSF
jgi:hypothetical protein